MNYVKYLVLAFILAIQINVFAGVPTSTGLDILSSDSPDHNAYAYYDLRSRKTFIQLTNRDDAENPLCIHVQIFQQDRGCTELDFNDELTPNDTVIYDLDNLIRNDGTEVPANLNDDSYGFVAFSAFQCSDPSNAITPPALIGNFRIIDDTGYEYRMNLVSGDRDEGGTKNLISGPSDVSANIKIPFNTVDGASHADVVGFVVNDRRSLTCETGDFNTTVCSDPAGVTFSVFQVDEDEERLSCDQVNFACGTGKAMHYGINDDYPASRGNNLLCEGAGLIPNQNHGYISLENASYITDIPEGRFSEFICLVGLNNNNGTGSMDSCQFACIDEGNECDGGGTG
ncbi:MAG: hypothetical protein GTO02_17340 [Candidatus Dadabacteria bacterium]|nr:hypothetical protein [Candidatus Dadabacteria bacterium]NIQ16084.1 hypothetical protein [Candidatus Dadabacteria bacterium]